MLLTIVGALSLRVKYKSDDMDDLLQGVITNKHEEKKEDKALGATDQLVQEAYNKAIEDSKNHAAQ